VEKQIAFPVSEFQARLALVRKGMVSREIDALALTMPDNIYYLTGYQTVGDATQCLIVTHDRAPVHVLRQLEVPLVSYTSVAQDVYGYGDSDTPATAIAKALHELGLAGRKVGVEDTNSYLNVQLYRSLSQAAAQVKFVPGTGILEAIRAVKSDLEVAMLRKSAEITSAGMRAAVAAVRADATENDVAAAAGKALILAGSEWLDKSPIVNSGYRSGIPHTSYARRRLEHGDSVLIELSGCYHRYFSPLMRSCAVGTAKPDIARFHAACQDALEAAMAVIKPGITSGEAHDACQKVIDKYGYTEYFKKRLGYSVGIGFYTWMEAHIFDLKAGDQRLLQKNMVLHMPPALRRVPEFGVGISETVVVTDNGCEVLANVDRQLFVKN